MATTILTVEGTHCESCKVLLEEVIRAAPGVHACTVDFATGKTEIEHDDTLDWDKLKQEVEQLGQYRVELPPA